MAKLVFHVDVNRAYLSWESAIANAQPGHSAERKNK